MNLLRVNKNDLRKLAKANMQVRNIILVPCCYGGLAEIYVNYDDMTNEFDTFQAQRDALADFNPENVIECTVNDPDSPFGGTFVNQK